MQSKRNVLKVASTSMCICVILRCNYARIHIHHIDNMPTCSDGLLGSRPCCAYASASPRAGKTRAEGLDAWAGLSGLKHKGSYGSVLSDSGQRMELGFWTSRLCTAA